MKMKVNTGKKKKDVVIDADGLIYTVALAQGHNATLGGTKVNTKVSVKHMKKHFKNYVNDLYKIVEILSITEDWVPDKIHLVYSDKTNFRYELYPNYKIGRDDSEKTPQFLKLRKWCHKNGIIFDNVEADDVVGYYVKQGAIGITADKDLYKGVAGIWYDTYHQCWTTPTAKDANRFMLLQCIMGDSTDDIAGVPDIGKTNVEKWLYEDTWGAVVNAYKGVIQPNAEGMPFYKKDGGITAIVQKIRARGLTEKDAILTRRLVDMNQWSPETGIVLWTP